jgi:hypothetical protein
VRRRRDTIDQQIAGWRTRHTWTPAMLRYISSCYAMDAGSWLRACNFLEAAYRQIPAVQLA